jgi:hypothetical protein
MHVNKAINKPLELSGSIDRRFSTDNTKACHWPGSVPAAGSIQQLISLTSTFVSQVAIFREIFHQSSLTS